jgi:hypothetical protein
METRRLTNPAMPRGLYWGQVGLYLWAGYALLQAIVVGEFAGAAIVWLMVFGFVRFFAAYGISNENKWGYWMGLVVCALTIIPTLNSLVHEPGLLFHPDFLLLLVAPVAIFFSLLEPSSRDYARTWFR